MAQATPCYVAVLRAINVAGKNKLPMSALTAMFQAAGADAARTYIQSGNVVFKANAQVVKRLPEVVADDIRRTFGYSVPVIVRSQRALDKAIAANPFIGAGVDPKQLHLVFLANKPTARQLAGLDPLRSAPDEFAVVGTEIFLRCAQGVGKSKLTNSYFDTKLATTSTARNWRTVLTLSKMCKGW